MREKGWECVAGGGYRGLEMRTGGVLRSEKVLHG